MNADRGPFTKFAGAAAAGLPSLRVPFSGGTGPYEPAGPIVDNIEIATGRLACCGAGPDRGGDHLPGCPEEVE